MMGDYCTWHETTEYWESTCGLNWVFTDGGLADNQMRYCPGCGRVLVEATPPTANAPQIDADSQPARTKGRSAAARIGRWLVPFIALFFAFHGGFPAMVAALAWALWEYRDGMRMGRLARQHATD